ncbi:MAG: hypothetical protein HY927_01325 [Elusimicrobia bacterium]|nr:hypothetical protein [Elusimicrobiota bacterium]
MTLFLALALGTALPALAQQPLLDAAPLSPPPAGQTASSDEPAAPQARSEAKPSEQDGGPASAAPAPAAPPPTPPPPAPTQPAQDDARPAASPAPPPAPASAPPLPAATPAEQRPRPVQASAFSTRKIWLTAYDWKGRRMDFNELLKFIGRADAARSSAAAPGLAVYAADGLSRAPRAELLQAAGGAVLVWDGPEKIQASLPWPVKDDGFSTVWIDKGGTGYADRDTIILNEEIAQTQHRLLKESIRRRAYEFKPPYQAGDKAKKLVEKAGGLIARAHKERDPAERAKAFDEALQAVSLAWQKTVYEHGLQVTHDEKAGEGLRFGLTLDESMADRAAAAQWVADTISKSGANWVRLVFKANPADFVYANGGSFQQYDTLISELTLSNVKVMACVLDTAQWPRTLTPEVYGQRVRNLVLRYGDRVRSWEVGSELNGDWLGGVRAPLSPMRVFEIYTAGLKTVKEIDPSIETVATLYWWDGTAPDREHSLFGWLDQYIPRGFGRGLDVVALSFLPEDNPVGMAFDRIFQRVHEVLPTKKLMLGSFSYVEGDKLAGYWWLDPADVDGGRKDLLLLYNAASCAQAGSVCGGFWWQTLDLMLNTTRRRTTDLFQIYRRSLDQLTH